MRWRQIGGACSNSAVCDDEIYKHVPDSQKQSIDVQYSQHVEFDFHDDDGKILPALDPALSKLNSVRHTFIIAVVIAVSHQTLAEREVDWGLTGRLSPGDQSHEVPVNPRQSHAYTSLSSWETREDDQHVMTSRRSQELTNCNQIRIYARSVFYVVHKLDKVSKQP